MALRAVSGGRDTPQSPCHTQRQGLCGVKGLAFGPMAHDPRQCSTQTLDAYRTRSPRGSAVIAGAFGLTGCPERGVTVDVGDQADPPVFDVVELLRLVVEAGDLLYGADWTSVPDVARWTEAKRQALS